jgi:hypothetical protein
LTELNLRKERLIILAELARARIDIGRNAAQFKGYMAFAFIPAPNRIFSRAENLD